MVGLGALFIAWDIYNIVEDSMKKSSGAVVREIADALENESDRSLLTLRD